MAKMSMAEARESFADIVNAAISDEQRTIITRRGKEVAVLVPITDLAYLGKATPPMTWSPGASLPEAAPAEATK
jgi:prevent-host-death family protein